MAASGTATIDFGAFPGASDASVTVTGQGLIAADSEVEAWVQPTAATADHSVDEHYLETFRVIADASTIVAGTGFTIRGFNCGSIGDTLIYGQWAIAWAWA